MDSQVFSPVYEGNVSLDESEDELAHFYTAAPASETSSDTATPIGISNTAGVSTSTVANKAPDKVSELNTTAQDP